MSRSYKDEEADIQRALIHHETDPTQTFKKLAVLYNVPYKRLLKRRNGRSDRSGIGGYNKVLSGDQETALCRIIDRCEHDGIHYKLAMITSIANFILRNAHDDPDSLTPTVGYNWINRFFKRYPEFNIRIFKTLAFDRLYAHDPEIIAKWYTDFKNTIALFGVT